MTRPDLRIVEPPADYAPAFRLIPSHNSPIRMERLTLFMRLNGETLTFLFAMAVTVLLVGIVVGAYAGLVL